MGAFLFKILGPLEVRYQGGLVPVRGSRERAVLAVLLLEQDRLVPVAKLIRAVWDDDPPLAAEKAVRNVVSSLRGRFAQAGASTVPIETDPAGYRLRLEDGGLDAAEFRKQITAARELASAGQAAEAVAELRAGLGLWRGPALAGIGGLVIEAAAAGLDEQRLVAWEDCLDLELTLGRHREVIGELRALVEEWPLRERLAAELMLALYRSGCQSEALDAYQRLAARLADELGIDPSAEISRRHEAILRQDPALDARLATVSEPAERSGDTAQPPSPAATRARPAQLPLDMAGFAGHAGQAPAPRRRRLGMRRILLVLGCTLGAAVALTAVGMAMTAANGPSKAPAPVTAGRPGTPSRPPVAPEPERRQGLLVMVPGQVADLDSMAPGWGIVKAPGAASDDVWFSITDYGLHGNQDAVIAILPAGSIGTFNECAKDQAYGVTLDRPYIRPGQLICDITNDHRVALLRIIDVQYTASRIPDQVTFDVVVWVRLHQT